MSKNTAAKFTLGALIGAVAGFVTGILIAPKSGKDLRNDITSSVKDAKDKTVETAEDVKDKVEDTIDDVKERAQDARARARNAVNAAKDELTKSDPKKK